MDVSSDRGRPSFGLLHLAPKHTSDERGWLLLALSAVEVQKFWKFLLIKGCACMVGGVFGRSPPTGYGSTTAAVSRSYGSVTVMG